MLASEKKYQQHYHNSKKRLIFACLAFLLLIGGAALWILSLLDLIKGPWTSVLPVIFTTLGVAFALLQWLLPFSFETTSNNVGTSHSVELNPERSKNPYILIEGVELGINDNTGALIIYTKKSKLGESVDLRRNLVVPLAHSTSSIVRRNINHQIVYAAIFPYLEPSDYLACDTSEGYKTKITVLPGQVTEIDWRGSRIGKAVTNSK